LRDYRQDGFDDGYGQHRDDFGDEPKTAGDEYSYREGFEDGQRRRVISDELDRELYGDND